MLIPKKARYRRAHRDRMKGNASRGNILTYGDYGTQVLELFWITLNQIEAVRRATTRCIRCGGNVWIKAFSDKPIIGKPAETWMGPDKGAPFYWVSVVKPGRVLFEMSGVNEETARKAMRLASNKLPIRTRFVTRYEEKDDESSES